MAAVGTTWQAKVVDALAVTVTGGHYLLRDLVEPARRPSALREKLACSQVTEPSGRGDRASANAGHAGVRYDRLWLPVLPTKNPLFYPWLFGLIWNGFMALAVCIPLRRGLSSATCWPGGSPTAGTDKQADPARQGHEVRLPSTAIRRRRGPRRARPKSGAKTAGTPSPKGRRCWSSTIHSTPSAACNHAYGPHRVVGWSQAEWSKTIAPAPRHCDPTPARTGKPTAPWIRFSGTGHPRRCSLVRGDRHRSAQRGGQSAPDLSAQLPSRA